MTMTELLNDNWTNQRALPINGTLYLVKAWNTSKNQVNYILTDGWLSDCLVVYFDNMLDVKWACDGTFPLTELDKQVITQQLTFHLHAEDYVKELHNLARKINCLAEITNKVKVNPNPLYEIYNKISLALDIAEEYGLTPRETE